MGNWNCFCGAKEGEPCKCPPACNATDKMRQERDKLRDTLDALFSAFVEVCGTSTGAFTASQVEAVRKYKEITGR